MPPVRRIRAAALLIVYHERHMKIKKRNRSCWVREWILRRENYGAYNNLLNELRIEDAQQFRNFIRMSAIDLEKLLCLVGGKIQKQDTHLRASIPASERLIVTLRFLATGKYQKTLLYSIYSTYYFLGDSYNSLMYLFRIPVCTMSGFIPEVCSALYEVLKDYIKVCFVLISYH